MNVTFYYESGDERSASLYLYWEVNGDPISDGYSPYEHTAAEVWRAWRSRYPGPRLPIFWSVHAQEGGIAEYAPFQGMDPDFGNFLTYFTWPVNTDDERIAWTALPVVDKFWHPRREDKGGFIQELTGWKPSPLLVEMDVARIEQACGLVGGSR